MDAEREGGGRGVRKGGKIRRDLLGEGEFYVMTVGITSVSHVCVSPTPLPPINIEIVLQLQSGSLNFKSSHQPTRILTTAVTTFLSVNVHLHHVIFSNSTFERCMHVTVWYTGLH